MMGQDTQVCSQAMVNDNEGAQVAPVLSDRESEAEGLLGSVLPGTSHDPFFYSPPHATDDTALWVLLPRSLSNLCLSSVLPYSISTVSSLGCCKTLELVCSLQSCSFSNTASTLHSSSLPKAPVRQYGSPT